MNATTTASVLTDEIAELVAGRPTHGTHMRHHRQVTVDDVLFASTIKESTAEEIYFCNRPPAVRPLSVGYVRLSVRVSVIPFKTFISPE